MERSVQPRSSSAICSFVAVPRMQVLARVCPLAKDTGITDMAVLMKLLCRVALPTRNPNKQGTAKSTVALRIAMRIKIAMA